MSKSGQRVADAFAHRISDRTPLFEIFQPYHPIYWNICGHNIATDMVMAWDACADGVSYEEYLQTYIKSQYQINKYFGLDMVRLNDAPKELPRPVKNSNEQWTLNGVKYCLNQRTKIIEVENPGNDIGYSKRKSEDDIRRQILEWNGEVEEVQDNPVISGIQKLAEQDGIDWVYMGEVGSGTSVAFYPPFMLMWLSLEPELIQHYLEMKNAQAVMLMRKLIENGCKVIAMGGDISSDMGPVISPDMYHELILPMIQEQVKIIHELGAQAVYTSDGNHWKIKDDFFFNSNIDGYREVDFAAGMTFEKLIAEGIKDKVCVIGNIDARHLLCMGNTGEVKKEVIRCLKMGQQTPGGHILHTSHSVHEDVKIENYYAMINAYREYFGLEALET